MFQCHDFKSFPLSGNIIKTVQEHGQLISGMQGVENVYGWETELQMLCYGQSKGFSAA